MSIRCIFESVSELSGLAGVNEWLGLWLDGWTSASKEVNERVDFL